MFQKRTLYIPFTILLLIATVQLALVSRMVAFLHIQKTSVGTYHILNNSTSTDGNDVGGDFISTFYPKNSPRIRDMSPTARPGMVL